MTPQDIFEALTTTRALPGEQVGLAIPQNLAIEVFKVLDFLSLYSQVLIDHTSRC